MPTPLHEYAEVRIGGQVYRDWLSVTVRIGIETQIPIFRLVTAEPDLNHRKIVPGNRVDIVIGDKHVVKNGIVKARQVSYDDSRHAVQIDGLANSGPALEASVNRKDVQFQNYKLEAIANKLLEPLKIKFKLNGKPKHADLQFRNFITYRGETIIDALNRLCNARGIWLAGDSEGNLVGYGGASGGSGSDLAEGRDIYKFSLYEEWPGADAFRMDGQNQGSDQTFGRKASEVSAVSEIKTGASMTSAGLAQAVLDKVGPTTAAQSASNVVKSVVEKIGLADTAVNQKEAQAAADQSAQAIASQTMKVAIEHQGWFKPGTQDLWKLEEQVSVYSPMGFDPGHETQTFKVWSVTWSQSAAGTVTTVELVNDAAFGLGATRSSEPTFGAKPEPSKPADPPEANHDERGAGLPAL